MLRPSEALLDPSTALIEALLAVIATGRGSWPDVGVFGSYKRPRMPGFAGFTRVQFWPSEHLFRRLNDGDAPPVIETAPPFPPDEAFAARIARSIDAELVARGEVSVPGLGLFGVQKRKTTAEDQYTVVFHAAPEILRRLNPKDADYEAALASEWPGGPPTPKTPEGQA